VIGDSALLVRRDIGMAGAYTEIAEVTAPSSAAAGSAVSVQVQVKNTHSYGIYVTVTGAVNGTLLYFGGVYHEIAPGASASFTDSFIMPNESVVLDVASFYWSEQQTWIEDDHASTTIALSGVPVGTAVISLKELEYDSYVKNIPVDQVSQDSDCRVVVKGKNTTSVDVKLGIGLSVYEPGSAPPLFIYSDWELGTTSPGDEHRFVSTPKFNLSKIGIYTVYISLYISPDGVNPVDTYNGTLCTTGAAEEFLGEITDVKIEVGASPITPPISGVQIGESFRIHVWAKNTSNSTYKFGLSYVITKPDGTTIERYVEEFSTSGPGSIHHFDEGPAGLDSRFDIDQAGVWSLKVDLFAGGVLADTYPEATMFTVVGIAPGISLITDYTYPYAAQYAGDAEECTFTFSLLPEQIPGTEWANLQVIQALENELKSEGAEMLKLQVYEDTTPALTTDYRVVATSTASPVPWTLIIVAVLAILFLVALTFTIVQIRKFLWGEEGEPSTGFGDLLMIMVVMMMMNMVMQQLPAITEEVKVAAPKVGRAALEKVKEIAPKVGRKALAEAKELIKGR